MIDYLLGLATLPAIGLVGLAAREAWAYFADRSTSYGCGTCARWWGPCYDGSRTWIAGLRRNWHMATSHPGYRGRRLVAEWRGVPVTLDSRMRRMFPHPPVTVWDVLARIPIVSSFAFAIAGRHGRKTR